MIEQIFDVKDKRVLITGSSRGLGYIIAQGLGRAGATIIINGRDEQRLSKAQTSLEKEIKNVHGYAFDVQNEDEIQSQISLIEQNLGSIDILINNAGIQIRGPLEEFSKKDWQKIMNINLMGAFLTSKAVVKGMINRRAGKIINICSLQSELARPTIAPYTASKGGLKMLTKGMATDWGKHNIQVNAIAPGYFKTEMTRSLYKDAKFDNWLCSRTPANRWGDPNELVGAAIFLSSDASNYVNGHILFVDGGLQSCV